MNDYGRRDGVDVFKRLVYGSYKSNLEAQVFRSFFAINLITLADILLHVIYLITFLIFAWHSVLIVLQLFAIFVGVVALYINHRGIKDTACVILTLEVGIYIFIWVLFLGSASYMQWFALCGMLPHYLFTEISRKKRVALVAFIVCSINACILVGYFIPPIIPGANNAVLGAITFNAIFFTLLLELMLSSIATRIAQTRFEESLAQEKDISMKDPLTGLWNRRYIQLQENPILALKINTANCIAILDIDRFKLVNDSYGHAVGDMMLQHFATLMTSSFRSTDVIIRWGGEEFMLLITGVGLERAGEMLWNFLKKTRSSPLQTEDGAIAFTFTAGVCELKAGMSLESVIETADKRLYAGKNNGRNQIVTQ